jgi:protocatechuate 3,4-dioxygenase beta subunit/outer membrane lipoprotein-sorting protein
MKHRIPTIALALFMTSCLAAEPTTKPATQPVVQKSRQVTCRGKVVDAKGKPLAGATVQAYEWVHKKSESLSTQQLRGETTTKADGAFSFEWTCDDCRYAQGVIVARKGGLAFDWSNWRRKAGKPTRLLAMTLRLGKPMILAGTVVGDSGQPVVGARVQVSLNPKGKRFHKTISGSEVLNRLITRTDSRGRFKFAGIPKGTFATFTVSAPGRTEINVPKRFAVWPPPAGSDKPFAAGRKDIRITLPLEAKIEGVVIDKATRKPIGNVALTTCLEIRQSTCVSGKDGRFSLKGLVPGRYIIKLAKPRMGAAEWVIEVVNVTTEAGKTTGNVKIELSKGGLVEVTVTDKADNKPLPGADVALSALPIRQYHGGRTDKKGVARIRLLPGTHRLKTVYKQGYIHSYPNKSVKVTEGKTLKLSVQMKAKSKIRVVVVDQADKPVAGARVHVMPSGGKATTDEDGKAEVGARISHWSGEQPQLVVVIRHVHRNLAAVVDIKDESKPLNVKLQQGTTLVGKVTGPDGKPIPGARISLSLQSGMLQSRVNTWSSSILFGQWVNGVPGRYEIKTVPSGRKYTVLVEADGFGQTKLKVELDEGKTGRVELKTVVLRPANLSISGVVVGADGKPVPGLRVSVFSDHQPHRTVSTDKEGKFVIKHVIAGEFRVYTVGNKGQYGAVIAKGGDKDIKIVVGQSPVYNPWSTSRPTTTASAPAVDPKVMAILKRLEAAGGKYPNITADIDFKVDMLQTGDTESRTGKVYYQGPGEKEPAKFRIHFDTLRQGTGPKIKDVVDYAFDGAWLTVRKERIKQVSRYQVARPGEKVNPLQLGKGPFPVPFGQKADTVIKHFRPTTRPSKKTDPKDTDYIKLTTRRRYRKEFSVVWLEMWIDRKTSLPVKIVAEDRSENQTTVIFKDTKTPKSFDKKIFTLPRPPAGWEYHVERFKGQVKP